MILLLSQTVLSISCSNVRSTFNAQCCPASHDTITMKLPLQYCSTHTHRYLTHDPNGHVMLHNVDTAHRTWKIDREGRKTKEIVHNSTLGPCSNFEMFENNVLKSKLEIKKKKIFKVGVKREVVIQELLKKIKKDTSLISTTGYTSRELFQIRKNKNLKNGKDFYMVGGMGHSLMVSLGLSMNKNNETICFR